MKHLGLTYVALIVNRLQAHYRSDFCALEGSSFELSLVAGCSAYVPKTLKQIRIRVALISL